jgi:bifunctional non-homologous end joining protein LigD
MDGYRLQIVKDGRLIRLYSRGGHDWTRRLSTLAEALQPIPGHSAVLDTELCLTGADGFPDFAALRMAMRSGQLHALTVFAFDLLHRDGQDLRRLPLVERKRKLAHLVTRAGIPCLHLVEAFDDGLALLQAAENHRLEGLVSKRRSSPYRSGECRDWLRVKTAAWYEANRERWRMFERS